jgi:phosphatidylserine decarboxylase
MIKLTMYGVREWGVCGVIALILIAIFVHLAARGHMTFGISLAVFTLVVWLAVAAFFRVPVRVIPAAPELIVAPADGVVKDITILKDCEIEPFKGMEVTRIGIFLSVFDVHVNRAPFDFTVNYKKYRPGKYLDARNGDCAKENEAMTIAGNADFKGLSFPLGIRQISGAIARRIVCPPESGLKLSKGEIYGMIKFGSRTELYIPASDRFIVQVKVGDRVYSGSSVMVQIKE